MIPTISSNDLSLGKSLLAIIWTFDSIALLILGVRIFTSIKIFRRLFISDMLMIIAGLFAIVSASMATLTVKEGFDVSKTDSLADLPPSNIRLMLKYLDAGGVLAILSCFFARISFAVWMLRLATERRTMYPLYFCIALTILSNVTIMIYFGVACSSHSRIGPGECWTNPTITRVNTARGALNSVTDLILTGVPAYMICKVRIPLRLKLCIAMILCLSIFAAAASIAKTAEFAHMQTHSVGAQAIFRTAIWFTVESFVIIVAASIPTIRPLFTVGRREEPNRFEERQISKECSMTQKSQCPDSRCLTSWTGYTICPFTDPGQTDYTLGNSITVEGGIREEKKWHNQWYKKEKDTGRVDVTASRSTF